MNSIKKIVHDMDDVALSIAVFEIEEWRKYCYLRDGVVRKVVEKLKEEMKYISYDYLGMAENLILFEASLRYAKKNLG